MARTLTTLSLAVFGVVVAHAAPASALQGYNSTSVELSSNSAACGLQDSDRYSAYLSESLSKVGVGADPDAPAMAELGLSAEPFEALGGTCVLVGTLAFTVPLTVDDVEVAEAATNREAIVAVFEEVETLPVVLYDAQEFTVIEGEAGDAAATALIDSLVTNFTAAP
jgi:hypothetical protein